MDKKSGKQSKEGPRVEKYREMLKRKAEEQGAQFVSMMLVHRIFVYMCRCLSTTRDVCQSTLGLNIKKNQETRMRLQT